MRNIFMNAKQARRKALSELQIKNVRKTRFMSSQLVDIGLPL